MRRLHLPFRWVYLMLLLMGIAVGTSAYLTISSVVSDQTRLHQESLTPAYDLVMAELFAPLSITKTIARSNPIREALLEGDVNQPWVFAELERLEREFGMAFFVASEKQQYQVNSSGTHFPLIPGQIGWYYFAKAEPYDNLALLGNRSDMRLYFDIKVYDDNGDFAGFVGASKSLKQFLASFEAYKGQFGYDFIFVDHHGHISLSSDPDFMAENAHILNVESLSWSAELSEEQMDNLVVEHKGQPYLVAEMPLDALHWTTYLLTPMDSRQAQIQNSWAMRAGFTVLLLIVLFVVIQVMLNRLHHESRKRRQIDALTQLPNRSYLQWQYQRLVHKQQALSLILVDLDHFKRVNDTYGHLAGDKVLRKAASALQGELREGDMVGRWGGEEFMILLPRTSLVSAQAIAERARQKIESLSIEVDGETVPLTASFGVAYQAIAGDMDTPIKEADKHLYDAKAEGRNKVVAAA